MCSMGYKYHFRTDLNADVVIPSCFQYRRQRGYMGGPGGFPKQYLEGCIVYNYVCIVS